MPDNVYALLFVLAMLSSLLVLYWTLMPNLNLVAAALRGEELDEPIVSPTAGEVHIWQRRQPILEPVVLSICRI